MMTKPVPAHTLDPAAQQERLMTSFDRDTARCRRCGGELSSVFACPTCDTVVPGVYDIVRITEGQYLPQTLESCAGLGAAQKQLAFRVGHLDKVHFSSNPMVMKGVRGKREIVLAIRAKVRPACHECGSLLDSEYECPKCAG